MKKSLVRLAFNPFLHSTAGNYPKPGFRDGYPEPGFRVPAPPLIVRRTIFARCILFAYYGRRDWAYKKLLLLWQLHWVKFEPKMCIVKVTVFLKRARRQISRLFHAKKWPLIGWLCRLTNQRPICHFHIFLMCFTRKFH